MTNSKFDSNNTYAIVWNDFTPILRKSVDKHKKILRRLGRGGEGIEHGRKKVGFSFPY